MKLIIFYGFIGFAAAILLSNITKCSADTDLEKFNFTLEYCQKANNISDEELNILLSAFRELESFEDDDIESDDTSLGPPKNSLEADIDDDDDWESWDDFDMKYKCYTLCVYQQMKLIGDDGKIDVERFKTMENINDSSIEIIEDCGNIHKEEENGCIYAFNVMGCIGAGLATREEK